MLSSLLSDHVSVLSQYIVSYNTSHYKLLIMLRYDHYSEVSTISLALQLYFFACCAPFHPPLDVDYYAADVEL